MGAIQVHHHMSFWISLLPSRLIGSSLQSSKSGYILFSSLSHLTSSLSPAIMASHHATWWRMPALLCFFTYFILIVSASPSMFRSREDSSAFITPHGSLSDRGLNTTISNGTTPANNTISAARKIVEEAMIQQVGRCILLADIIDRLHE